MAIKAKALFPLLLCSFPKTLCAVLQVSPVAFRVDDGIREKGVLDVMLPAGGYRAEWISPLSGEVLKTDDFQHADGTKSLAAPQPGGEVALRIARR